MRVKIAGVFQSRVFSQALRTAQFCAHTARVNETADGLHIPQWTLADRLNKTLRDARLSTGSMAEYLEVHRNTVINWVQGRTKPPASAVKLWSMRVGVPYEWLAHGVVAAEEQSATVMPRSDHRSRHLELDLDSDSGVTTQELLNNFRKQLRGDRRGSIERRRNAWIPS